MEPMYYIGLDVHKRKISYCVKDSSDKVFAEGLLPELILVDHDLRCWQVVIPKDDRTLKRELLRNFLNYLGVEPKSG